MLFVFPVAVGQAQTSTPSSLPVYQVVKPGVSDPEASALAKRLEIPDAALVRARGKISFVDAEKYLAFPSAPVAESGVTRRLREATKNKSAATPIALKAIDARALDEWQVLDEKTALNAATSTLDALRLSPQFGTATAGHNVLTMYSKDGTGKWSAKNTQLDTHVSYKFSESHGIPLIGPGAQVHLTFDASGHVTQLHYAARSLKAGAEVKILSEEEARGRIAQRLPAKARITMRLVYWTPPLEPVFGNAESWRPATIIPWYAYYSTTEIAHPSGAASSIRSRVSMIPATDDARFVPTVTVSATADGPQVRAHAEVRGGTPPYTYIWGGSDPEVSHNTGNEIRYTARTRAARQLLRDSDFHLRTNETVAVTVIDANGVVVHGRQIVPVQPQPIMPSNGAHGTGPTYGAESPDDPGNWTPCRVGWQNGMSTPGAGGGTQSFAWLGGDAWPGDFIEPKPAGTLVSTPWVNGDADFANWGINTADLVIDIADGNADTKTAMQPGAPTSDYATAFLCSPNFPDDVGINGNGFGTPKSYTIDYAPSWGPTGPNDTLDWLLLDDCDMLDPTDGAGLNVAQRWGLAFNGLHVLAGFSSLDYGDGPFENAVANNILGVGGSPQTIVQSWFSAAQSTGAGTAAAMGPAFRLEGNLFWMADIQDYYWGKGSVGPTIVPSAFASGDIGFWFLNGSNANTLVFP
jgi:hypothetical protein